MTGSFAFALAFQTIVYILSIYYFVYQLTKAGFKLWIAMISTAPLFFSPLLLQYGHTYLTESLATGMSIFAFASLIPILTNRHNLIDIMTLSLATFLAILTRPAFVFIPPFAFLAYLFLGRLAPQNEPISSRIKAPLIILSATIAPLLAYATLRLIVVGHFGLVSFGGTNLAGLALNPAVLTTEVAGGFKDKETRDAAQAILRKRHELFTNGIPKLPDAPKYLFDEDEFSKRPVLETWSAAYNISCWEVGVPAIASHLGVPETRGSPTWPQINMTLSKISREAILANPTPYMQWVQIAITETARKFFRTEPLQCKIVTISILLIVFLALWSSGVVAIPRRPHTGLFITLAVAILLSILLYSANYAQVFTTLFFLINGTISPVVIPGLFLAYGICNALTSLTKGLWKTPSSTSTYSIILSAGALYLFAGVMLVVLVEDPLDRYILAVLPPFSVGIFLGISLACDYLVTKRLTFAKT